MTATTDQTDAKRQNTVIAVDAMGGDSGPSAIVAGCAAFAKRRKDVDIILHGPQATLEALVLRRKQLNGRVTIRDAAEVVSMKDKPSQVVRHGKKTSMWATVETVRSGDASVAVSCGNTGALMAVSMIRLRKLPGVNRPAIAVLWPSSNPEGFNVMLDVGADIRADADDLMRYALMGASYARNGMDLPRPRIGLLNVGTEEHKGRPELHEAYELIAAQAEQANFEFVGFVEGGDIPGDIADVIVTDGFTGNIAIKTGEGTAGLIGNLLRQAFKNTPISRLAYIFAFTSMQRLKRRIDPRRVNGGVFLGLNGMVVKSHGSADATGVAAALQLAAQLAENGFTGKLAARVAAVLPTKPKDQDA
jgi:glycerol-3-phosphate acyltransferase PlsX